jgi:hypothetical protein
MQQNDVWAGTYRGGKQACSGVFYLHWRLNLH